VRSPVEGALLAARLVTTGLLAGVVVLGAVALRLAPLGEPLPALVVAAALAGLVSPLVAWRVHRALLARVAAAPDADSRCAAFLRSTIVALAVAEGAALFGLVVYLMSADPAALTGVVTFVLVAGALWPRRSFLETLATPGAPPE
jgi:F0F1-type ATP synthase membrane subunit c/vacuolar-type H+-ATPase subunit K